MDYINAKMQKNGITQRPVLAGAGVLQEKTAIWIDSLLVAASYQVKLALLIARSTSSKIGKKTAKKTAAFSTFVHSSLLSR